MWGVVPQPGGAGHVCTSLGIQPQALKQSRWEKSEVENRRAARVSRRFGGNPLYHHARLVNTGIDTPQQWPYRPVGRCTTTARADSGAELSVSRA